MHTDQNPPKSSRRSARKQGVIAKLAKYMIISFIIYLEA
jgi:hypothetical protein